MDTQQRQQSKATRGKHIQAEVITAEPMAFADSRIPEFKSVRGERHVRFGDQDDYPEYLQMLFNKSAKHNAIVNNKCVYILGNGFKADDPAMNAFLTKANEKQSWDDLVKPMCLDIENTGGVYLEVIPKNGGGYNYYHLSHEKVRTNEDNSKFWYKKNAEKKWWSSADLVEYPAFKPGIRVKSIYYYKEYRTGKKPYALPSWVAACNWIESDIEVSKCTLTNAKTGFSASKLVTFPNGEPEEAKKKSIQKRMENTATGAEGKKVLISFVDKAEHKPLIDDLGQSDLTKEDFGQVDELITSNIFAGHGVTHPLLFGIQQSGKLGSSTELKLAFDIFKNTYANAKQRNIENIVKHFAKIAGIVAEVKLQDVEPIGLEFSEQSLLQFAPRSWLLEKMNIDPSKYTDAPPAGSQTPAPAAQAKPAAMEGEKTVNTVLTNLTGKQQQQILRIVRQFGQEKITLEQATLMLKSGFGFTDEDVAAFLGLNQNFKADYDEMDVALMFSECGEDRQFYEVMKSDSYAGEDESEVMQFAFKTVAELTDLQTRIVGIIKKDKKATSEIIAKALDVPLVQIDTILKELVADKILKPSTSAGGTYEVTGGTVSASLPKVLVRYSYEKRAVADGPEILPTTRPFCKKLLQLNRFYTREEIQMISERLGYSVFKRAGGFWFHDGKPDPQCRHEWRKNIVVKKS